MGPPSSRVGSMDAVTSSAGSLCCPGSVPSACVLEFLTNTSGPSSIVNSVCSFSVSAQLPWLLFRGGSEPLSNSTTSNSVVSTGLPSVSEASRTVTESGPVIPVYVKNIGLQAVFLNIAQGIWGMRRNLFNIYVFPHSVRLIHPALYRMRIFSHKEKLFPAEGGTDAAS